MGNRISGQPGQACRRLGWDKVDVLAVSNLTDARHLLTAERDENVCRKDFTPSEMKGMADRLKPLAEAEAKDRQKAAGERAGRGMDRSCPPGQELSGRTTRDDVADAVGTSHTTLARIAEVIDTAEDKSQPASVRAVAREEIKVLDDTGSVAGPYRRWRKGRPIGLTLALGAGWIWNMVSNWPLSSVMSFARRTSFRPTGRKLDASVLPGPDEFAANKEPVTNPPASATARVQDSPGSLAVDLEVHRPESQGRPTRRRPEGVGRPRR